MKFFFSHFFVFGISFGCPRAPRVRLFERFIPRNYAIHPMSDKKKVIKDDCIIIQWTVRSKLSTFDNASLFGRFNTLGWQLSSFIKLTHSRRERQVVKDETFSVLLLERRYKSLKFQDSSSRDGGQMKYSTVRAYCFDIQL